ncbi:hypothetical protein Ctob_016244 [Chrysochromulina tobinii]|uniref:Uncharacterized protein n=1 Tax=Chrysochromulina tobinii TaxID=1460289 RepID=A0A0M0KAM8_9EUKA|nr:hypothetical protein Ctob_016244 [Chrysochromulina tobinii]|eukprot:KOO35854.1 hypothetical protein Ctob_016244 [Chrysochromulina sp. CCMP291]
MGARAQWRGRRVRRGRARRHPLQPRRAAPDADDIRRLHRRLHHGHVPLPVCIRQAMTRLSAFGCSGSREDPALTHEFFESVPFALLHHTTCVSYRSNCTTTTTTTAPKISTTHQIGTCSSARAPPRCAILTMPQRVACHCTSSTNHAGNFSRVHRRPRPGGSLPVL